MAGVIQIQWLELFNIKGKFVVLLTILKVITSPPLHSTSKREWLELFNIKNKVAGVIQHQGVAGVIVHQS